jgi:hypothetical protein
LFVLEHKFGKSAIEFGEPLVRRAKNWPTQRQARLHAALARAYALTKDDEHAGKEAVLTTQLVRRLLQTSRPSAWSCR